MLQEIDKPAVADDDVLVCVHASSLNLEEWHAMTGLYIARTPFGLLKPKSTRLGIDFAGVVGAGVWEAA